MDKIRKIYRQKNKEKIKIQSQKYKDERPWLGFLSNIQQRCENPKCPTYNYYGERGIKCLITAEELKELWFRDKAYLLKWASIDRKNSDRNYTFENCEFIEHNINCGKESKKKIFQFDLNGNFIKQWVSTKEASVHYNTSPSNIWGVLNNKRPTACGFYWKKEAQHV